MEEEKRCRGDESIAFPYFRCVAPLAYMIFSVRENCDCVAWDLISFAGRRIPSRDPAKLFTCRCREMTIIKGWSACEQQQ